MHLWRDSLPIEAAAERVLDSNPQLKQIHSKDGGPEHSGYKSIGDGFGALISPHRSPCRKSWRKQLARGTCVDIGRHLGTCHPCSLYG
eukprot:4570840-Amphidinium_carterae.2